jgi:SAM-dependent methyltransferase
MMMDKFNYDKNSQVIEIASNDGCLLQNFLQYNVPVLGIDPTSNTAELAEKRGVKTLVDFFGAELAQQKLVNQGIQADLLIGNNVLAHVPNINDFVKGMKIALKEGGVITMEFPHLMRLIEQNQFDTIYHEHFSYLSLMSVNTIFKSFGLQLFDVEELPTHGGSLRIYAKHQENDSIPISPKVESLIQTEIEAGMLEISYYTGFQKKIENIKYDALTFLIGEKRKGKKIIGYGAASKGNTFINYCGIKGTDIISFVVDASPFKQGKYLPGSHIPVLAKDKIKTLKPDYVIILPWNIKDEVIDHLSFIREWDGKFVTFIPETKVF